MKQWLLSLGVLFLGLVTYTLVKAAWPEAVVLRSVVAAGSIGATAWAWHKLDSGRGAKG